jgi:hypothetical protein
MAEAAVVLPQRETARARPGLQQQREVPVASEPRAVVKPMEPGEPAVPLQALPAAQAPQRRAARASRAPALSRVR